MYGSAAHGAWCGAKTYPTRCRFCGKQVFYFECNCGSKVFFSSLGSDWPEHRCIEMLTRTFRNEFVQRGMALQMMQHPASRLGSRVEKRYQDAVERRYQRARTARNWITRVSSTPHARVSDKATVRELIPDVDMFHRFGLMNSSLAKAFLGVFGQEPFMQITLHIGHLAQERTESYTAFMPSRELRRLGVHCGDLVLVRLIGVPVGKVSAWLCESLEFVDDSESPPQKCNLSADRPSP